MWLVGVVSRRWVWLVGGIYGYGYHVSVWLVGGVVKRCIDILIIIINFPYSTCIRSLFGSNTDIRTSLFIFKCFFGLDFVIFLQYIANVTHRTFEIFQTNRDPSNYLIISVIKNGERSSTATSPETSTYEVPNDV